MKNKRTNYLYIPTGFFAGVLVCLVCLAVWESGDSRSTYAQDREGRRDGGAMTKKIDTSVNRLSAMLFSDGVSVHDASLLPSRVENSHTALVRLESVETATRGKDLETRLP